MDVDQSHDDKHKRETPSDDDDERKRDAPSDDDDERKVDAPSDDGDDSDYKPNNDLQPPPSSDDEEESQTVLVAADDGKFYVRGMAIECLDDADPITREHARAFYDGAIPLMRSASQNWQLMLKEKHDSILSAFIRFRDGEKAAHLRGEFPQCYKWFLSYAIVKDGEGGFILCARPQSELGSHGVSENTPLDKIKRVTYMERVFVDLKKAHGDDHCKGQTIVGRMNDHYANVGRNVTKIFTGTHIYILSNNTRPSSEYCMYANRCHLLDIAIRPNHGPQEAPLPTTTGLPDIRAPYASEETRGVVSKAAG
jgi:hypothetical protein